MIDATIAAHMLQGILNLDKPAGISSAAAVGRVKRMLPRKTKIGHAGTLDPFATGVLLLLVGKATKQCEQLMGQRKGYGATIKLGATTATDDPTAPEEPRAIATPPEESAVRAALEQMVGSIEQRPPVFSALKVGGRRAYQLAREGEAIALAPRIVQIYSIELLEYAWPLAKIRVECGRGTYIRAIARDLGEALSTGGYLTELRRTFVGEYHVSRAATLDVLNAANLESHLHQSQ